MKEHIDYIDNAKGILIVLVVLGHILPNDSIVKQFIYIFHMPAFFIISGILMHFSSILDRPIWKTVLQKVYTLMIPYCFFELIALLVDISEHGMYQNIKGYVFDMLTLNVVNYVDWFLPVLFLAELCFAITFRCIKSKKMHIVFGILAIVLSAFLASNFAGVGTAVKVALCYGFLMLGYYGFDYFLRYKRSFFALALIVTLFVTYMTSDLGIANIATSKWVLFLIGAVAGTYYIFQISKWKASSIFKWFGQNSLIVMGTHVPLLSVIQSCIYPSLGIKYNPWTSGIAAFVLIIILEIPIICLLTKCLPFFVGKKNHLGRE